LRWRAGDAVLIVSASGCARRGCRKAFADMYAGEAGRLAERMGRAREKEMAKREQFKAGVQRLIPPVLLASMGLLSQPPHCQVSVPAGEAGLLLVTPDDLRLRPGLEGQSQVRTFGGPPGE
jgi:hypothetical protein